MMALVYDVFISYAHADEHFVNQLEKSLLTYSLSLPISFKKKHLKIFRDKTEAKGNLLSQEILSALAGSKKLIVVCSTNSFASKWVSKEITAFLRDHKQTDVIPILIDGTPETSFPQVLVTAFGEEPWAPDFRFSTEPLKIKNNRSNWYHLLACLYETDRKVIEKREFKKSLTRFLTFFVSVLVISLGVFFYLQQRTIASQERLKKKSLELISKAKRSVPYDERLSFAVKAIETYETDESITFLKESLLKLLEELGRRNYKIGSKDVTLVTINDSRDELFISSPLGRSILYKTETGEEQIFSNEQYNAYRFAQFSDDGKLLATINYNDQISIWNIEGNNIVKISTIDSVARTDEMSKPKQMKFSSDNELLLVKTDGGTFLIQTKNGQIAKQVSDVPNNYDPLIFDINTKKFSSSNFNRENCKIWSFLNGEVIWPVQSINNIYEFVSFGVDGNSFILKKKQDKLSVSNVAPDFFSEDSVMLEKKEVNYPDSFLVIKMDNYDRVIDSHLYDESEIDDNALLKTFDPEISRLNIKRKLSLLDSPINITKEQVELNFPNNTAIIYAYPNAVFYSLDSFTPKFSFSLASFLPTSTQFSKKNKIVMACGSCNNNLDKNIHVWKLPEALYIDGIVYDNAMAYISNDGSQIITHKYDSISFWNVNEKSISLKSGLNLYAFDEAILEGDKNVINGVSSTKEQLAIAKRWLSQ